jgi:hypothetical protein
LCRISHRDSRRTALGTSLEARDLIAQFGNAALCSRDHGGWRLPRERWVGEASLCRGELRLCCGKVAFASGAIGFMRRGIGLWRLESRREGARHNEETFTLGWECRLDREWAHARQSLNGGAQPFARFGELWRRSNNKWNPRTSRELCGGSRCAHFAHKIEPLVNAAC